MYHMLHPTVDTHAHARVLILTIDAMHIIRLKTDHPNTSLSLKCENQEILRMYAYIL